MARGTRTAPPVTPGSASGPARTNGGPAAVNLRVQPPAPGGPRRRVPELVVGVLLIAGCGLGALLLATGGRDRTPVVALADDVARGEVVEAGDLTVTYLSADSPVAHLDEDERDALVGRVALSDLPDGTIVTADQFADPSAAVRAGDGTVGLALEPGQLPSLSLAPGDLVNVVAGGGAGAGTAATPGGRAGRLVEAAQVVTATRLEDDIEGESTASWWVSLRTSEQGADAVAGAAASGSRLQLVLVGR